MITDRVDGLWYTRGDVDELEKAMTPLRGSPEARAKLGAAARAKADKVRPGRLTAQIRAVYVAVTMAG